MTIIHILATMLWPALGYAKGAANRSVCQNQVRSLSKAFCMYTERQ